jgi:hypothetical protein
MTTRTFGARCAPYPKQNDDHWRRHENITIQSVREQQIHSKIPNRAISVSHNVSVQSFKALSVNIAEHKSFVNYIVSNTSSCSTQALNGSSNKQYVWMSLILYTLVCQQSFLPYQAVRHQYYLTLQHKQEDKKIPQPWTISLRPIVWLYASYKRC